MSSAERRRTWQCHRCRQGGKSSAPPTEVKAATQKQKQTTLQIDLASPNVNLIHKEKQKLDANIDVDAYAAQTDVSELKADTKEIKQLIAELSTKLSIRVEGGICKNDCQVREHHNSIKESGRRTSRKV